MSRPSNQVDSMGVRTVFGGTGKQAASLLLKFCEPAAVPTS